MQARTKTTLQVASLIIIVAGLLVWWVLYRLGVFAGPDQQRQAEIMKTLNKNNNDFLKLLEQNANFLASSTPPAAPASNTNSPTSTNQQ